MNLEHNIEKLEKKIQNNAAKIDNNAEQIERNRYALDILKEFKNDNKRYFVIILFMLVLWTSTVGYLVYVLNDTGTEEITSETYDIVQDSGDNGNNNFVNGNNNEVAN